MLPLALKLTPTLLKFLTMKLDRFTSRAVPFLIAFAFFLIPAISQQVCGESPRSRPVLGFGQTIALSDFDSDGLVDEARLDGAGLHKRVGIRLSGSGERVSLHLGARWPNHGSLLARDLDYDGAADLIWTDLLHIESVVVWLGDGRGRFTRSIASAFSNDFVLADSELEFTVVPSNETAANFENDDRTLSLPLSGKLLECYRPSLSSRYSEADAFSSPFLDQPTDRGPPTLLS